MKKIDTRFEKSGRKGSGQLKKVENVMTAVTTAVMTFIATLAAGAAFAELGAPPEVEWISALLGVVLAARFGASALNEKPTVRRDWRDMPHEVIVVEDKEDDDEDAAEVDGGEEEKEEELLPPAELINEAAGKEAETPPPEEPSNKEEPAEPSVTAPKKRRRKKKKKSAAKKNKNGGEEEFIPPVEEPYDGGAGYDDPVSMDEMGFYPGYMEEYDDIPSEVYT